MQKNIYSRLNLSVSVKKIISHGFLVLYYETPFQSLTFRNSQNYFAGDGSIILALDVLLGYSTVAKVG